MRLLRFAYVITCIGSILGLAAPKIFLPPRRRRLQASSPIVDKRRAMLPMSWISAYTGFSYLPMLRHMFSQIRKITHIDMSACAGKGKLEPGISSHHN